MVKMAKYVMPEDYSTYITESAPYVNAFSLQPYLSTYGASFEEVEPVPEEKKPLTTLSPKEIGITSNPFARPIQAIMEKLREGASKIEVPFFGVGKGSKQSPTPESIGKVERQAIRDLAKINEVEVTTHAAPGLGSLAGLREGKFSDRARFYALKEIEKAIDFASQATSGGAVVVHLGEFPRDVEFVEKGEEGSRFITAPPSLEALKSKEKAKEELMKERVLRFVNKEDGSVLAIRLDQKLPIPEYESIDVYLGKEKEKMELIKWKEEKNAVKRLIPVVKEKPVYEILEEVKKEYKKELEEGKLSLEGALVKFLNQRALKEAQAEAMRFYLDVEEGKKQLKKMEEKLKLLTELKEKLEKEGKGHLFDTYYKKTIEIPGTDIKEVMSEIDYLKKLIDDKRKEIQWKSEHAAAYGMRVKEIEENIKNMVPIKEFALEKTADTLARAALVALEKTKEAKKKDPNFKPIYIAPENVFPEEYGSHPEEIEEIIEKSRKRMKDYLIAMKGYSEKEAEKLAKQHIKATIDIGHLNIWRKYFKPSSKAKTPEEIDKEFKQWAVNKIKKLAKKGIIGHIHVSDNFGYDDEHLSAGHGNAPIKEILEVLEKEGIRDLIIEVGSFNPTTGWREGLVYLGSPIYGVLGGPTFASFINAHAGYNRPIYYIAGAYAPSNEWTLWSGVPLE